MNRELRTGNREPRTLKRQYRGFTLIELLVIVGILVVLVAIAVPMYHKITARGKAAHCIGNLRQIGAGLNLYLAENNMVMPTMVAMRADKDSSEPALDTVLDAYLEDERVFRCAADTKGLWRDTGTSYVWNSTLNGQSSERLDFMGLTRAEARIPVIGDKENFHRNIGDEVNMLYADGHVDKKLKFKESR